MNDTRFAEAVDEPTQMLRDSYKYPTRLMATVARLPLNDALDIYAGASNEEKKGAPPRDRLEDSVLLSDGRAGQEALLRIQGAGSPLDDGRRFAVEKLHRLTE